MMVIQPVRSFSRILEARPTKKVAAALPIAFGIMAFFALILIIIEGKLNLHLGNIIAVLFGGSIIFMINYLILLAIWHLVSVFYSWLGRRFFEGAGNTEDTLLVLGLFLIAGFLIFSPVCFFEMVLYKKYLISEIFSSIFTIVYITAAFKVVHRLSTIKALSLFLLPVLVISAVLWISLGKVNFFVPDLK